MRDICNLAKYVCVLQVHCEVFSEHGYTLLPCHMSLAQGYIPNQTLPLCILLLLVPKMVLTLCSLCWW